ncbi:UNVERIFIED_CONTAM: phage integrase family protein [Acidovorax defluvii]
MVMAHSTPEIPAAQPPAENGASPGAGNLAVADFDGGQPLEAAQPAKPARRRGRPPGSRTKIAHDTGATADEFAMLRAVAQGVDLTVAARQYLLWPGRAPERPALIKKYQELLDRIEAAANGIEQSHEARAMVRVLRDHQTIVIEEPRTAASEPGAQPSATAAQSVAVSEPVAVQTTQPPTLEEFAAQFDPDMFSEAELIERYEDELLELAAAAAAALPAPEAVPSPTQAEIALASESTLIHVEPVQALELARSAGERMKDVLHAINWLDEHLGTKPERAHRVEQWVIMSAAQMQALRTAGVITLGNLVDWMSLQGATWYDALPGYGVKRADNLLAWILRWNLAPAEGLSQLPALASATTNATSTELQISDDNGLQPLTLMKWPADLMGTKGTFRKHGVNTMSASNDLEAVKGWFRKIKDLSPFTQEAYQRSIERLILWAIHERKKALSSLDEGDFFEFKDFLIAPPPHWVQAAKGAPKKQTTGWRPLRGPLNSMSLNVTFAAVRKMFAHWKESGYIGANAAQAVHGKKREEETMDVFRSFTEADLEVVGKTFADLPEGAPKRRLRALFRLLENAGLRRAEVAQARWSHVETDRALERNSEARVLQVLGKGKRFRKVPLNAETMEALREHRRDRQELVNQGRLKYFSQVKPEDEPLIGVLDDRWIWTKNKKLEEDRNEQAQASRDNAALPSIEIESVAVAGKLKYTVNEHGALCGHMLYQILKGFFAMCSLAAGERTGEAKGPFMLASTHWLRHTYAHKALEEGNLSVVQGLLGHKNINTTAIYVKAGMSERIKVAEKLKSSV